MGDALRRSAPSRDETGARWRFLGIAPGPRRCLLPGNTSMDARRPQGDRRLPPPPPGPGSSRTGPCAPSSTAPDQWWAVPAQLRHNPIPGARNFAGPRLNMSKKARPWPRVRPAFVAEASPNQALILEISRAADPCWPGHTDFGSLPAVRSLPVCNFPYLPQRKRCLSYHGGSSIINRKRPAPARPR